MLLCLGVCDSEHGMATLTTQQLFDDAVEKYHLLQTGQAAVEFQDQNGERVRYTAANAARLLNYIGVLAGALGVPNPFAAKANAPLRFHF